MPRPPHKKAHAPCPNGALNWTDCDLAVERRWGRCTAMVGKHEPEPCSRWAVGKEGWCWQHFVAETERVRNEAHIAIERTAINERIDAYIEWTRDHPSVWDSRRKARGRKPFRLTAPV